MGDEALSSTCETDALKLFNLIQSCKKISGNADVAESGHHRSLAGAIQLQLTRCHKQKLGMVAGCKLKQHILV